jgi:hypothetical protein
MSTETRCAHGLWDNSLCDVCHPEIFNPTAPSTPAPQGEINQAHSINCIHCPHLLQYHLSGVLEGTKRGCTQCDCPGFESKQEQDVAPGSPEADQRRKHPHYQLIQRLDDFLHKLCGDQKYKQEADELHGEIHDAAFWFVTRPESAELHAAKEEHAQWRVLISEHLVAAREERDAERESRKQAASAARRILDCLDTVPLGLKDRVIRDEARSILSKPVQEPAERERGK